MKFPFPAAALLAYDLLFWSTFPPCGAEILASIKNEILGVNYFSMLDGEQGNTAIVRGHAIAVYDFDIPMGCSNIVADHVKQVRNGDMLDRKANGWKLFELTLKPGANCLLAGVCATGSDIAGIDKHGIA